MLVEHCTGPIFVEVALRTHRHSTHGRRAVPPRTDITTLCYHNCVVPSDTMSVWLPHIPRMGVQYLHVAALPPPSRIIVSRPHPLHITFHTPTDPDLSWCTTCPHLILHPTKALLFLGSLRSGKSL